MIVKRWMTTKVVTIHKEASIQEALSVMKQASIRHLPVVEQDRKLIGWVTDADLRGVLIASMLEELTLADVMIRKPIVATPNLSMDEAAQMILEKRIGGLPVVEGNRLVGVITVVDVLSAFITLMGMLPYSSRLDVDVSSAEGALSTVLEVLEREKAKVVSFCHLPATEQKGDAYSIRLKKCDTVPIIQALKRRGIKVLENDS